MNAASKVCLGISAGLLVATAGGMSAANACPKTDAPACTPAAPEAPATPALLRVTAPAAPAAVTRAVLTPDPTPAVYGLRAADSPAPVAVVASGQGKAQSAWTFDGDGQATQNITIVSNDNGETYDVRMKDGNVIVLHNGDRVDDERVLVREGNVIVLDDGGDEIRRFNVRRGGAGVSDQRANRIAWADSAGGTVHGGQSGDGVAKFVRANQPPVMVGIYQSEVPASLRWHLGLKDKPAIMIERVIDGLPAADAGIRQYDVIVSIEGSDGATGETLSKVLRGKSPGDKVEFYVISKGDKRKVTVELKKYDAAALGSPSGIGIAPSQGMRFFSPEDENEFLVEGVPDMAFDFSFGDAQDEIEHKIHEEIQRKHEAILRQFEKHVHQGEHEHEAARRALEEALAQLDTNIAERVELAERQARAAKQRVLELRGDRLVFPERFADRSAELRERGAAHLEDRLAELEDQMARMHESMEHRMERLMHRMEMMLERAERDLHEWHEDDED